MKPTELIVTVVVTEDDHAGFSDRVGIRRDDVCAEKVSSWKD